ncbi:flavin reductase family protein [Dongia sp.]|jgi:flavin reductase (DIM6/NTAB) family NADH-FMN oxidoreductase RutF|uniref:flavin reductase family protein n=1 Tax=Dongia sp. TaxID=1977262 RepID=UPI0035AF8456
MFYEPRLQNSGLAIDPLKALVVPRPIGWISSVDLAGRVNLAPFSFFNMVADSPPIVMFAPSGLKPDGSPKDSLRNVEAVGAFVVNLATWDLREQMNATSARQPAGVNEAEVAGLEMVPSTIVAPPRVKASPVALECRYLQSVELPSLDPGEPNTVLFGDVVGVHVADHLIENGRVDITKAKPIARMGYSLYTVVDQTFRMTRPD